MLSNPKFWLAVLLGVTLLPYIALKALSLAGKRPERGNSDPASLAPCPDSPNCVCSEEDRADHAIAPLRYDGADEAAWSRLRAVLERLGGAEVRSGDRYLLLEFRTRLIGFVDDVECRLDPQRQQIEIRSASRVGYSDLGSNRRRVEAIRAAFESD